MSKAEIKKQFDAIVDFAGVEQFLDTPVKRYSSGMYVRLAFSVAAHLQSDILIIDEVLAVGDSNFQKKCLGKMSEVADGGRTVFFVSHNMAAVNNLCKTAINLLNGKLRKMGLPGDVIADYSKNNETAMLEYDADIARFRPKWVDNPAISSVSSVGADGQRQYSFPAGTDLIFELRFEVSAGSELRDPVMGIVIHHALNGVVGGVNTRMTGHHAEGGYFRYGTLRCMIAGANLLPGLYAADIWLGDGASDIDALLGCLQFEITEADLYGTGKAPFATMGSVFLRPRWSFELAG
jgi:lipopolysaccharide transport system ATP-binding protein